MSGVPLLVIDDGEIGSKLREWSSLIGIITAIVGNILISFALNIQRYAHLRLTQENAERSKPWFNDDASRGARNYGTQQSEIANGRPKINLEAPLDGFQSTDGKCGQVNEQNGQTAQGGSIHSRSSSEYTINQLEKPKPEAEKKTYLKSPYWWLGIALMITGEAGNFIAYGFAPASIVSPLGVVALVSNCIIAPCFLKERFRLRDFWGVAVAIGGAVTIVLSAKNSETKMGPDDVWAAITRWEFETYLGITTGLIIFFMWLSEKRYGEQTILIDLGLVGLFGGFTALSTKGVASLLSDTLWRTLTFPVTYLLVFVLVLTALMQIRYVNRALQRFDSTQVIPVQFVLFTISVIIGSAVLYRDFQSANANRFGKFFGGCALTFLGVYLVTSGRSEGASEGFDDDTDDEENTIGLVDEERYRDEVADNEDRRPRRKSSISFNLETDLESRQSSRQQTSSGPRTPPLLLSQTSTASSRLSTRSQDMLAPLTGNSWRSADVSARPRPNNNAISSPLLPSEAQCTTPPAPKRPSSLSRRSMARLTPGPLMSPLSASLSAVIADELRRGVDSPSRRSRVRKSRSQRTTIDAGETTSPLKNSPLKTAALPEEAVDEEDGRPAPAVRSRTISATMGNFFQLKGDRSKGKGRYGNDDTQ